MSQPGSTHSTTSNVNPSFWLRKKLLVAVVAALVIVVALWATLNGGVAPTSTVKSSDRASQTQTWTPYDGMSPDGAPGADYFPAPFMPVFEAHRDDAFKIAVEGAAAPIYYSAEDAKVVEVAANALSEDIERVTGWAPAVSTAKPEAPMAILIGTLGQSTLIDGLVGAGKIDVSAIEGKWEAYRAVVVDNPLPGVEQGLVVVGSDRRGTAYGVFGLSESIGVSPWHFWGDVPAAEKSALYTVGSHTQPSPGVKYRGIFINDEDWGFQPWAANTFEPEVGNVGPKTYATVFELLLRLHANMIWPAMHEFPRETTPFYKNPDNKIVADNYAIVISTSHHEPMLRNSHEYDESVHGPYNYWSNRDTIYNFWEERVIETADYENIYTMGLRGRADAGMLAPEGASDEDKAAKIQNSIIPDQRQMIAEHVNADPSEVPQIFIPYKETLVQYQSGLELPDDITIVWPDDNHGYIRQLSNAEENTRSGGSGVYYHLSYWGVPESYLWLNSTPPGMTRSEMMKAWDFDAHRIWIVNVGDIKPHEIGTEFFLRLARNPEAFRNFDQHIYFSQWSARTFGREYAEAIADVLMQYFRLNIVKRPEHLDTNNSGFSHISRGDEAKQRLDEFAATTEAANRIYEKLAESKKAAFYEMIFYPVRVSNLINQRVLLAEKSRLWASQERAATNGLAQRVEDIQATLFEETRYYNEENAGGKWNHMISPMPTSELARWAHDTQNAWEMPETGSYKAPEAAELGVAIEGQEEPLGTDSAAMLPVFNRPADSRHFIDIFNKGQEPLQWSVSASAPWVELSQVKGEGDARIVVSIDWEQAPRSEAEPATITIAGAGSRQTVGLEVFYPEGLEVSALPDAVENNGTVIVEAENFSERTDIGSGIGWRRVDEATASRDGMTVLPVTADSIDPQQIETNSPSLSYRFHAFSTGLVEIGTQTLPTHRITSDHPGVRYAISLNGDTPQIVDINAVEYSDAWNINTLRAAAIGFSKHEITEPGLQTVKIWMVDAGVVLDRLYIAVGSYNEHFKVGMADDGLSSIDNGRYIIYNREGDLAIDAERASREDGANVQVSSYEGGDNQQFRFAPVSADGTPNGGSSTGESD